MNIMVASSMAWDDTNSIGNTFSNWFSGKVWENDCFSHIYLRKQMPNNKICSKYYQMSVFEMANLLKTKEKIGKRFEFAEKTVQEENNSEGILIGILHRMPFNFLYWAIDIIYRRKRWINKRFEEFVNDTSPDIVFICVNDVAFVKGFIDYIKHNTNSKIVSYISDDYFSQFKAKAFYRRKKLLDELDDVILNSDLVLCASEKLKNFYEKKYSRTMDTIYKGCDVSGNENRNVNSPMQIVYAGNLFYGRDKVILRLARAIQEINLDKKKFYLKIYCGDDMSFEDKQKFNIEGVSEFCGKKEYSEICAIQRESDFVLIPESFDEDDKLYTRYSFSTKIPDGMQSGCNILGIGPVDISTIEYLSEKDFAFVITDISLIKSKLLEIYSKKEELVEARIKSNQFVRSNFEIEKNCEIIRKKFECLF